MSICDDLRYALSVDESEFLTSMARQGFAERDDLTRTHERVLADLDHLQSLLDRPHGLGDDLSVGGIPLMDAKRVVVSVATALSAIRSGDYHRGRSFDSIL